MKTINKVIIAGLAIFLLAGCGNMMNTPTKKVEAFLGKYQTMDNDVLEQLDDVIASAGAMTDNQKKEYRELMKKQYQNLSYKIKDEKEDGTNASVEVEIEVYDYGKAISEAETYLTTHREEFLSENKVDIDTNKFLDYKIDKMDSLKDKIKYTINFTLAKVNDKWQLDNISDVDRQKLHGLYY